MSWRKRPFFFSKAWLPGGLRPALGIVLAIQTAAAVAYILFVVFPAKELPGGGHRRGL
jgi:hypothetical protein